MTRYLFMLLAFGIAATGVSCGKEKDPGAKKSVFEVADTPLAFIASPLGPQTVDVTAENVSWDASVNADARGWLSCAKSGKGFAVTATANEGHDTRTATITVTPAGANFAPVVISVSQNGIDAVPVFEVSAAPLEFAATPEGPLTIAVTAEHLGWTFEVSEMEGEWLKGAKVAEGLSLTAQSNGSANPRTAVVTITPEDAAFEPVAVNVTQKGGEVVVELPAKVDFGMVYSAQYYGDDFKKGADGGRFAITFMNVGNLGAAEFESFTLEGFMPLAADATQKTLPLATGDYTCELAETFTGAPHTFLSAYGEVSQAGTYYMSTLHGTDNQLFFAAKVGTVNVADAGEGKVRVTAKLKDESGKTMELTYTGALALENTLVEQERTYNTDFTICNSAKNMGQYFAQPIREYEFVFSKKSTAGADEIQESLTLKFNVALSADGFPSGKYLPFTTKQYAEREPMTFMRGGYTWGVAAGSIYTRSSTLYQEQELVLLDRDDSYVEVTNHGEGTYTFAVRGKATSMDSQMKTKEVPVTFNFKGAITIK